MARPIFSPTTPLDATFLPQLARRTQDHHPSPAAVPAPHPTPSLKPARRTAARVADFSHHFPRSSSRVFSPTSRAHALLPFPLPPPRRNGRPGILPLDPREVPQVHRECAGGRADDCRRGQGPGQPVGALAERHRVRQPLPRHERVRRRTVHYAASPPARGRARARLLHSAPQRLPHVPVPLPLPLPLPSPPPLAASSTRACTPRTPRLPRRRRTCSAPSSCTSTA
jgi:hypothetical protein